MFTYRITYKREDESTIDVETTEQHTDAAAHAVSSAGLRARAKDGAVSCSVECLCSNRWNGYTCEQSAGHIGMHATGGEFTCWSEAAGEGPETRTNAIAALGGEDHRQAARKRMGLRYA